LTPGPKNPHRGWPAHDSTDACFLVCNGHKGLPEVVSNVWLLTAVRTCIVHRNRNTFRQTSKKSEAAALKRLYSATRSLDHAGRQARWQQTVCEAEPTGTGADEENDGS
jgi:transposase-like protein